MYRKYKLSQLFSTDFPKRCLHKNYLFNPLRLKEPFSSSLMHERTLNCRLNCVGNCSSPDVLKGMLGHHLSCHAIIYIYLIYQEVIFLCFELDQSCQKPLFTVNGTSHHKQILFCLLIFQIQNKQLPTFMYIQTSTKGILGMQSKILVKLTH